MKKVKNEKCILTIIQLFILLAYIDFLEKNFIFKSKSRTMQLF